MSDYAVQCITAPNAGVMTGNGTNSYLLGNGSVLIDPGPANAEHIERLIAAADGRLQYVLVTHTHLDHSPAAKAVAADTGAVVVGLPAPIAANQDVAFVPALLPQHDEILELADLRIRAIHTPGHASNHVCYLDMQSGLLFTGDHINQGTTVVIPPPDGSMRHYIASLELLKNYPVQAIAPGHGSIIHEPLRAIESLIRHRLQREAKTFTRLSTLGAAGPVALEPLLVSVYDDVPVALHPVARLSLLAHLEKLVADERVIKVAQGPAWIVA